ncbi:general transcription factor II-I repeat domain-containing protein 1-like [Pseudochaenichthys georgianus]|uniref:general transcription factor II-I repeat domain-containing protein 1-like n=1 Tax=Pseudochaenichthys georgianus TaxID=52239 RepID=UPI0039C07BA1
MRKLACDGIRTNSRGGVATAPLVSARQEILTSLVSALDSVCMAMSKLNAEVACVTVHEDSVIAVGTEKGRVFLNSRREIQTDFYKFCRGALSAECVLSLTPIPKSRNCGESSLVPVPYERILKDPGCVVAHGLPEGASLKKPSEYDTKTLMKILEQSHRIQFTVKK